MNTPLSAATTVVGEAFAFFCWARHRHNATSFQKKPDLFALYNSIMLNMWRTRLAWRNAT